MHATPSTRCSVWPTTPAWFAGTSTLSSSWATGRGTLVRDEFAGYESVVKLHNRKAAGCLAHARRKFDELIKDNQSPGALQAVQRIAWIYRIEREEQSLSVAEPLAVRQS